MSAGSRNADAEGEWDLEFYERPLNLLELRELERAAGADGAAVGTSQVLAVTSSPKTITTDNLCEHAASTEVCESEASSPAANTAPFTAPLVRSFATVIRT